MYGPLVSPLLPLYLSPKKTAKQAAVVAIAMAVVRVAAMDGDGDGCLRRRFAAISDAASSPSSFVSDRRVAHAALVERGAALADRLEVARSLLGENGYTITGPCGESSATTLSPRRCTRRSSAWWGGRGRRRGRRAAPLPPAGARRCLASSPADWCAPLSPLPVAGARCCLALSPTGRRAGIPASRHDLAHAAGIQSRRLPDLEKSKAGGSGTFSSPSCLALASHR
jgi:hypothetical protein